MSESFLILNHRIKLLASDGKGLEIQITITKPTHKPSGLKPETKEQTKKRIDRAIEDLEKGRNVLAKPS